MQRAGAEESLGANDGTTVFNLKSIAPNRSSVVVEHGLPDTCEEIVCADGAPGTLTNLLQRSHNVPAQHVGLDQCFTIDGAFSDPFLDGIDRLRLRLPYAKVRCPVYCGCMVLAYVFTSTTCTFQDKKKTNHSRRRYFCDIAGDVSRIIRIVLRSHGFNLTPLSKMRFLECTSAGEVLLSCNSTTPCPPIRCN